MYKKISSRLVFFFCVISVISLFTACGGDNGSSADEQESLQSSDASVIDDESSSSVEKNAESKSSSSFAESEDSSSSEENVDPEAIPTSMEGVNGYMQKGPFLSGSKVRVLELESGRTLNQTGLNFETKIQTDDGKFKLNARTMVSQYVELHAEGYYRNEVSGKESEAPITLYAITDVRKRDGGLVNINLLTHLEYQRVVYLVKEQKMKVYKAKAQAQQEVLAMLDITGSEEFASSEDLNIVGTSEADGALLAFSIMFQGDRSVAKLTSLLQSVVNDLEEDGKWDDVAVKTEIADWAETQDHEGYLDSIRKHVADWKLGPVPEFEKYVRHFWYSNYRLGVCSTENSGEILKNGNRQSAKKAMYFVCENKAWREMTDFEKDTYDYVNENPWTAGFTGEVRKGAVTNNYYAYDGEKWRETTEDEREMYDYVNNKPWNAGEYGERKNGAVTDTLVYIFDGAWRKATKYEALWGLCDESQNGNSYDGEHICSDGEWKEKALVTGSLWNMNPERFYQVQTPEVVECTGGDPGAMDDNGAACFQNTEGWWFAYDGTEANPGTEVGFTPISQNPEDGSWKLIMADMSDGSIIPGGNLVDGQGLRVTISTAGGASDSPAIGGIGFYWTKSKSAIDISSHEGFCLDYSLSGAPMYVELGWNTDVYGFDTWRAPLSETNGKTLKIPWSAFSQSGWDKKHSTTIATATENVVRLNIVLQNGNINEWTSEFTIHSLGWLDECD